MSEQNDNPVKTPDNKPKKNKTNPNDKKNKKVSVILVAVIAVAVIACAVGLVIGINKSAKKSVDNDTGDDTGLETYTYNVVVTDENGNAVTDENGETETVVTSVIIETDEDIVDDTEEQESTSIIVKEGESTWPSALPTDIPQCKVKSFTNNCSYEDKGTEEFWQTSWYTTESEYNTWIAKVQKTFAMSDEVAGYYANGKELLDIYTEDSDEGFWVSMDVTRAKTVSYPSAIKNIPSISTDATLYSWELDTSAHTLSLFYACAESWSYNIEEYKETLSAAGYTVTDDYAEKGNVKISFYGSENGIFMDEMLVITY